MRDKTARLQQHRYNFSEVNSQAEACPLNSQACELSEADSKDAAHS